MMLRPQGPPDTGSQPSVVVGERFESSDVGLFLFSVVLLRTTLNLLALSQVM